MTFKNILLVYSEKLSDKHLKAVDRAKKIIDGIKHETVRADCLNKDDFSGRDLVIALGGDGTFIKTAKYLHGMPLLAVNSEPETSEGALASLDEGEIGKISDILNGNYKIKERNRISVKLNGKFLREEAVNEVFIGTKNQFHPARYVLELDGKREEHRSSGVLVSTDSGSKAWYKSAGGKPFSEDKIAFIVREPFVGRVFKPNLLQGFIKDKIKFESKKHGEGILVIDASTTYDFNSGDKAEVCLSDKPLNAIVPL